jgi:hypothetical protein
MEGLPLTSPVRSTTATLDPTAERTPHHHDTDMSPPTCKPPPGQSRPNSPHFEEGLRSPIAESPPPISTFPRSRLVPVVQASRLRLSPIQCSRLARGVLHFYSTGLGRKHAPPQACQPNPARRPVASSPILKCESHRTTANARALTASIFPPSPPPKTIPPIEKL